MAPKRPLHQEPQVSSSSEEEEEEANSSEAEEQQDEEDVSSSEEQEEEKEKSHKKPEPSRIFDYRSDSDDSGSETETKPTRSLKRTIEKPSEPAISSATKLQSERDSKRAKNEEENWKVLDEAVAEEDPKKKQLFQRLWSDEDEIAVLKGAIEYMGKKGGDPIAELNEFHEFVKKSLRLDFSKEQFRSKIKRLKKRFENNLGKGKKGGDRSFSKAHEQELYDLSKKIWGSNGGEGSSKIVGKEKKLNAEKIFKIFRNQSGSNSNGSDIETVEGSLGVFSNVNEIVWSGAPRMGEEIIKQGLEMIGSASKRVEWEEKWKKQQEAKLEVFLKRTELTRELMKMALEAHKSAGH